MGTVLSKVGLNTTSTQISQTVARSETFVRVKRHYDEISKALNPIQLMPLLCKEGLLEFNDKSLLLGDSKTSLEKSCHILNILESKGPLAYSKFLSCVQAEKSHMGHEYIASLLQDNCFGSEFELKESLKLKEAVNRCTPEMMDICPRSLVPLMFSKNLLTDEEQQQLLSHHKTKQERILSLLQLLNTKGPTAHGLFADCLRSESSHPTHNELYVKLLSVANADQCVILKKRKCTIDETALAVALPHNKLFRRWELEGVLKGHTYNEIMRMFQSCNHNGDWESLEVEATKYMNCHIPEYQVVAYLEKAISWIFRRKPKIVIELIHEAREIIHNKVHGENSSILLGRSEYILSRLHRYLKNYDKAREHVANAKDHLYCVEAGEDSAFVHYCDACITIECLNESSTQDEFERVDEIFGRAICDDRSHDSGLGLVAPHSLIRLAQMYLGATHYSPGMAMNQQNIEHARNCLKAVIYSSLSYRSRCHYHLMESDLHRNSGNIDGAKQSLHVALSISEKYKFELEISSAQTRLQSLIAT